MPILTAIFTFLSGWFARFLGAQAIRFIVWKAFIWALMITVLPVILYNLQSKILSEYLSSMSNAAGGTPSLTAQLTGLVGWFAIQLKVPQAFSILMAAAMFRLTFSIATAAIKK